MLKSSTIRQTRCKISIYFVSFIGAEHDKLLAVNAHRNDMQNITIKQSDITEQKQDGGLPRINLDISPRVYSLISMI
jgi:hypothetical protein